MLSRRQMFDPELEYARMAAAAEVRVGYEARWWRGSQKLFSTGACLEGPYGEMIQREIEGRFASGPPPGRKLPHPDIPGQFVQEPNWGYPLRWAQIAALCDPSSSPLRDAVRQLSLLYRRGLLVTGDISSLAWSFLESRADIDRTMLRKQAREIGQGSIAVRPTLERFSEGQYYPPALTIVNPECAIAVRDPGNPSRAHVFIEFDDTPMVAGLRRRESVTVWDISNPNNPYWGRWRSLYEWQEGLDPIWLHEGWAYPWWWQGEPIMPAVCSQWDPSETELLPASRSELQGVKDLVMQRAWINVVGHTTSFPKTLAVSQGPMKGLERLMADPSVFNNVWGPEASIEIIPDGTEGTERLWSMHRQRLGEWAQRYDQGFVAREEGGVQPDTATGAGLRLVGKYILRQQMETRARKIDTAIIQALIATWNYLQRSRQFSATTDGERLRWTPNRPPAPTMETMIPEGAIELSYPHYWSADEKKEIREEIQSAVDRGQESPRALYLLDHDLEDDRPDGPNWQLADERIRTNLEDSMAYAQLGYGLRWETRHLLVDETPDDEASQFDVPDEVAVTASRGLDIRDDTGLGPDGSSGKGRKLLQRARRLAGQVPFSLESTRRLNTWLKTHELDDHGEDTDTGVNWLTQGGEPGLKWTNEALAGAEAPPEPESTDGETQPDEEMAQ